jgi:hypothetical protein
MRARARDHAVFHAEPLDQSKPARAQRLSGISTMVICDDQRVSGTYRNVISEMSMQPLMYQKNPGASSI